MARRYLAIEKKKPIHIIEDEKTVERSVLSNMGLTEANQTTELEQTEESVPCLQIV